MIAGTCLCALVACSRSDDPALTPLDLAADDYAWIAQRIYQNEALGQPRYLTHWNEGEDFPSFGIGHFIWFPTGVDAPFDEQFPAMAAYVREHSEVPYPDWLARLEPFDAPWDSKAAFDEARDSRDMRALRDWLEATADTQARYIVQAFTKRWNALELPGHDKAALTAKLETLLGSAEGLYAVIDYYNFKGLGSNPRERYADEGWGLVQVLSDIDANAATLQEVADIDAGKATPQALSDIDAGTATPQERFDINAGTNTPQALAVKFGQAAADRLLQRVSNAPAERGEARWLTGWLRRVGEYGQVAGSEPPARFAVTPYLLRVSSGSATLRWFTPGERAGTLLLTKDGDNVPTVHRSVPEAAAALQCHPAEPADNGCPAPPVYRHTVTVDGLVAPARYQYTVIQDGEPQHGSLRTAGDDGALRFIVYGDSETEPESAGTPTAWPSASDPERRYPLDQLAGYRANLRVIAGREPAFVAIAGDLVESGGEQRDWQEFWRLNGALARNVPIYPAPGNHDYFGGPGELGGYGASARAIGKFESYFGMAGGGKAGPASADGIVGGVGEVPPGIVGAAQAATTTMSGGIATRAAPTRQSSADKPLYHAIENGPVTLVVIDGNNGLPERTENDSNWYLEGNAPASWQPGGAQRAWLEATLARAQERSRFTFVMLHHAPYSSGVHGLPPGLDDGQNFSSGLPLRALTPLFHRYGVDAMFSGHDEHYEHSVIPGEEVLADGSSRPYDLHAFVIGTGGDGLRAPEAGADNPFSVFLADRDAPEVYDDSGTLIGGGRHYGHLEVNVRIAADGRATARIEPVYLFPLAGNGKVTLERRVYDDVTLLEALR